MSRDERNWLRREIDRAKRVFVRLPPDRAGGPTRAFPLPTGETWTHPFGRPGVFAHLRREEGC